MGERKTTLNVVVFHFLSFPAMIKLCQNFKMKPIDKKLRRKNEILKKKITEISGQEMVCVTEGVSEGLENQFLQNVLAFETQHKKKNRIKIIEKIGNPSDFKPVNEIQENEIEQEWLKLYNYMYKKGIDLQVCSPNVNARDLYRFTTEEFFKMKIDDVSIPGMMTCFIYDEFYPDHRYDNQRMVVDHCIKDFFCKEEILEFPFNRAVTVNNHEKLTWIEFQRLINSYRSGFEKTKNLEIKVDSSIVENNYGKVSGSYKALFIRKNQSEEKCGNWDVELCFAKKLGYWQINNIRIEGILCRKK